MTGTGAESGSEPTTSPAPAYGSPPPYGQQPPGWPTSPPPLPHNRGAVIAAVTVGVVLLVACFGLAGGLFLLHSARTAASDPATPAPLPPTAGHSPAVSPAPGESEEPTQDGPRASAYAATEISDLNRVCDENIYYPQSPQRAGKAPHPLVLLVADRPGLRYQDGTYYFSQGLSKKVEQAWASEDPRTVQLVACLDRVSTGSTIRSCKYDDPKPVTFTLLRAGWRLRVYEVSTGRKLLDKAMAGDDQACPFVTMAGADKKIYAKVSDKAVVATLRNLVNG